MNHALAGLQIFKPKKHSYLSHFWLMFPFYTPRKNRKIEGSLVFSEGVKWERWREMDYATDLSVTRVSVIAAVFHQAIIHLVSTQNFPKSKHFLPPLPPPVCTYTGGYQEVKNVGFSENFAHVLSGRSLVQRAKSTKF